VDPDPGPLPPLYGRWMDEALGGPVPDEPRADCARCPQCEPAASPRFHPQTKCCTYVPRLPNFLVGALLLDEDPAFAPGRASVRARIAAGVAATPLGLDRPRGYELLYADAERAFGRSRALRCPHFVDEDGGRCGIWRHREATCASWFCRHARGVVSVRFWSALHRLLAVAEGALARHCVERLDPGSAALEHLFPALLHRSKDLAGRLDPDDLDGRATDERRLRHWGSWFGREEELYRECAAIVSPLRWKEIVRLGGPELAIALRLAREAYHELLDERAPSRLRLGRLRVLALDDTTARLETYSPYDLVELPRPLFDALPALAARPVDEAAPALGLDEATVRRLVDFAVLEEG